MENTLKQNLNKLIDEVNLFNENNENFIELKFSKSNNLIIVHGDEYNREIVLNDFSVNEIISIKNIMDLIDHVNNLFCLCRIIENGGLENGK